MIETPYLSTTPLLTNTLTVALNQNPTDAKVGGVAKPAIESMLAMISQPIASIAEPVVLLSDGGGLIRNVFTIAGVALAILSPLGIIGGVATTYAGLNLVLTGCQSLFHDIHTGNKEMAVVDALRIMTGLGYMLLGVCLIITYGAFYGGISAAATAAVAAMLPIAIIGMFGLLGAWAGQRFVSHWKFGNELQEKIKELEASKEGDGSFDKVRKWLLAQLEPGKNREYLDFNTSEAAGFWAIKNGSPERETETEAKGALLHSLKELQKANRMHLFRDETHILIAALAIAAGILMILTPPGAVLAVAIIFIVTASLFVLGDSSYVDRYIRDTFFKPKPLAEKEASSLSETSTTDSLSRDSSDETPLFDTRNLRISGQEGDFSDKTPLIDPWGSLR